MSDFHAEIVQMVAVLAIVWPVLQAVLLLFGIRFGERMLVAGTAVHACLLLVGLIAEWGALLHHGSPISVSLPPWFSLAGHEFKLELLVDRYSVGYGLLSAVIYGVVARYSFQFLHRASGVNRFFLLISALALSLVLISHAGCYDLALVGWELAGTTSVFLIAFFQQNHRSVQNSFRAIVFYRTCDAFLLFAAVLLHHSLGNTDLNGLSALAGRPEAGLIALCILLGTLAKSAQLPTSGWLPRAMEGPTASSAIFYGALSVHLGPLLLVRFMPVWEDNLWIRAAMFGIGALTAIWATLTGRVRADAKTGLAFAVMAQVGLMYCELALLLPGFVLYHIIAHAGIRTWQFLRSSSLIQDFQENPFLALNIHHRTARQFGRYLRHDFRKWLYLNSVQGFYLDHALEVSVVNPVLKVSSSMRERAWGPWIGDRLNDGGFSLLGFGMLIVTLAVDFIFKAGLIHSIAITGLLVTSGVLAVMGLTQNSFRIGVWGFVLSILSLACAGTMAGHLGEVAGGVLVVSAGVAGSVMLFLIQRIKRFYSDLSPDGFEGLASQAPRAAVCFLVFGLLMSGLPGAMVWMAEDFLFQALLDLSPFAAMFFISVTCINAIAFFRLYMRLFLGTGPQHPVLKVGRTPTWDLSQKQAIAMSCIGLAFFLGCFWFRR